jgi:hypothetical protein
MFLSGTKELEPIEGWKTKHDHGSPISIGSYFEQKGGVNMAIVRLEENIEPFLVNPVGRRIGRKKTATRKSNFYINPRTSRKTTRKRKTAKRVVRAENFYINPKPKKRTKRKINAWFKHKLAHRSAASAGWRKRKRSVRGYAKTRGASFKRNPFGDELLLVSNPRGGAYSMKKRSRKRVSRKRTGTRRRRRMSAMHNPMVRHTVRRHRKRATARKHHRRRTHAVRRRNPIMGGLDFSQMITGAASALANVTLPIALKADKPLTKYGIQIAAAIGGKFILEKLFKARNSNTWMIVGLSMTAADAVKEFILKKVTLMTPIGPVSIPSGTPMVAHGQGTAPQGQGMGAYLDELPSNYGLNPFQQAVY